MIIQLSKEIYSKAAIERAIHDYSSLGHFQVTESETYYICKIINSIYDSLLTANEYENYVIALMNQKEFTESGTGKVL